LREKTYPLGPGGGDPVRAAQNNELAIKLDEVISTLKSTSGSKFSKRIESIMELRHGLHGNRVHNFDEIGKIHDVGPYAIQVMSIRAMRKMQELQRLRYLKGFLDE